ncbi:MAG: TrmH family RNA methyltransferase [Rhodanobacter sp.]|jgi:tRNA G18 (ribose-2'-O)-methylase SpoU
MANVQLDHSQHRPARAAFALRYLVHDFVMPMNVGSVFRIADALGVEMVHLTGGSAVPPNRKLRRTSRGTEQHVPFRHDPDPLPVLHELKAAGYRIVSLELTGASIDIRELPVAPADRLCLVLGSENRGVSQALLDASDHTVHIPMLGVHSSMNVATACAIASFEITRAFALPPA